MCTYEIELMDSNNAVQSAHIYRVDSNDKFMIGHFTVDTNDRIFSGNAILALLFNAISMCRGAGSRIVINCGSDKIKSAVEQTIESPEEKSCEDKLMADHLRYLRGAHGINVK